MWYWKRPFAVGLEAGYSQVSGQFSSYDALSVNAFAHLKLIMGFYAEGGYGSTGVISDGRTATQSNSGLFWSLGYTHKLGRIAAIDLQYRRAPAVNKNDTENLHSGIRLGLSLKL